MRNIYKKIVIMIVVLVAVSWGVQSAQAETYTSDLTLGNSGPQVVALQTWLESNGYLTMPQGVAKGYFGGKTRDALASYQRVIGLPAYGFFGPMTRERLNRGDNSAGALNVISPSGGENWQKGTIQTIKWNSPKYFKATMVDIRLISYTLPCYGNGECAAVSIASYDIAKNISANTNSYSWNVGSIFNVKSSCPNCGIGYEEYYNKVIDGQYLTQICESGTNVCASSKKPFDITSQVSDNDNPVIVGVTAPTTLTVGQAGTWTIKATDPQNGVLSYSIHWGDEPTYYVPNNVSGLSSPFVQTSSFTHTYSVAGVYDVSLTVKNSAGKITQAYSTVKVTDTSSANQIKVISPNGGENWLINSTHQVMWSNPGATYGSKVDLYLDRVVTCPAIHPAPASCYPAPIVLDKNIGTNSVYNWIVGTDVSNNPISAGEYILKICSAGTNNCDRSDSTFTLTSALLQICPTVKIIDAMPSTGISSVTNTYYILNNQRREIKEFDTDWVASHCSVPNQIVY